jgi:large subunit ribosomal protein L4
MFAQLANQRKGTADTKTRGEVRGGTHKMWRQKGTGRARQGDRRAPHWTGGGVVFGPHPRSYHLDLPRKMRRLAMTSALSARLAESALTVVDDLALTEAKTREVRVALTALGVAHECDLTTRAGGHSWAYFDAMAPRAVGFLNAGLEEMSRRLL